MKNLLLWIAFGAISATTTSCNSGDDKKAAHAGDTATVKTAARQELSLPAPYATESANDNSIGSLFS